MSEKPMKKIGRSVFRKKGVVKVQNGEYEKEGITKKRWNEIGVVFGTPNNTKLLIKFHNTAQGEGQMASVFWDEGCAPRDEKRSLQDEGF